MLSLSTDSGRRLWVDRSKQYWHRHRTLFWTLHSLWALATGVVVIVLARERYGFVPWVVAFLVLIWASTLFFGRRAAKTVPGDDPPSSLGQELTSYATRVFYQETLFFLLPFYAYSTVVDSPNVLFLALLTVLAVLACLDLVFDRWLRLRITFALMFFATIAFAAINLLLPMIAELPPRLATPLAAAVAIGSAIPLALRGAVKGRRVRLRLAAAALLIGGVATAFPSLVPPVPLRLDSAEFAADIDPQTLDLQGVVGGSAVPAGFHGRVVVLAKVFAPGKVPSKVHLEWLRNGRSVRTSREVAIVAHEGGFRIWDALPTPDGVPPGRYRVELSADGDRVFGAAKLTVDGL